MRREFILPQNAIEAEASIDIAAPPEQVARAYRDVERWGQTFPATIARARVIEAGENWRRIQVDHRQEGPVPNTLYDLSATQIGLEESKHIFDASFVNSFEPGRAGGTHFRLRAYVRLKGIYLMLKPFLKGYVRRRALRSMREYVLEPLKAASERPDSTA